MTQTQLALHFISKYFIDILDKGGEPYIFHLLEVERSVRDCPDFVRAAALLHDSIEDIEEITPDRLIEEGFSLSTVTIVKCLSKKPELSYMDNIQRLIYEPYAVRIKMADLKHNSDITRLKGVTQKDLNRLTIYAQAYNFLSKIAT